jgi:hypothetical protein
MNESNTEEEHPTPSRHMRARTTKPVKTPGIPVKKKDGPTTGPPHPRGKSWHYVNGTDNKEQIRVREACKSFGISYASSIHDTIDLLERYVNHYKLGLTVEGRKYGKMA